MAFEGVQGEILLMNLTNQPLSSVYGYVHCDYLHILFSFRINLFPDSEDQIIQVQTN